ncbi:MAG: phosphoribosylamine--glycine ligase [Campylobacterales bacterium]
MKILIIGSGGREYSIARALKREDPTHILFFAPGNGATHQLGTNLAIKGNEALAQFAREHGIELTIVGPEAPLTEGIVDCFRRYGLVIFGPTQAAARLEGSKAYMKSILTKYAIPTSRYIETTKISEAESFINTLPLPIVVKADGLCAGKGVIIAQSREEAVKAARDMLMGVSFGAAGSKVVIEEYLDGFELSVFALSDGKNFKILPPAQDHKRLLDHDQGPNTGGMGAYAPTPLADAVLMEKIRERIIKPTIEGMAAEGVPFEGVLFAGIMVVNGEPYVLEFNVRFGDPECEELMALLDGCVTDLFYKGATGRLDEIELKVREGYAVGVVMASKNYPYGESTPAEIIIDEEAVAALEGRAHISYAGVSLIDGKLFATGGRVLVCVGEGATIREARDHAYELVGHIHFAGKQCRTDIAWQVL